MLFTDSPERPKAAFRQTFQLTGYFDSVIYFYYTDRKGVQSALLPNKIFADEVISRTREIMAHPRFFLEYGMAKPPLVLLGYGLDPQDLFASIEKNCPKAGW